MTGPAAPDEGREPAGASSPGRDGGRGRERRVRVGVDIGGTFTDVVALRDGADGPVMRTLKVLSTPDDPARAVLEGVREILRRLEGGPGGDDARGSGGGPGPGDGGPEPADAGGPLPDVVHGSTVATNAVLERKGPRTAFVTTRGFADLLAIARQTRPDLYDFFSDRPDPLVPPELCFEVGERVDRRGEALERPSDEELAALARELAGRDVESVALCFLFSFLRPEHEARAAAALEEAGLHVSASSEVHPEFREYERASTTAVDAFVTPVLDRYLGRLEASLPARRFRVMQSSGGSVAVEAARRRGVGSILSGPAAGVVGASSVARQAGLEDVVTLDMGGTSTDVSLVRGEPGITREARVGGLPVAVPAVDVHTVGSGGGSLARVDPGGALRVGPESAGADPGPACYGRGGRRPTVTDAHLVLGRLAPGRFLGGEMELDPEAARLALADLGREAGLPDPAGLGPARAAALGVVRVADARMERALRVISVERGHDPADFVLVSFGGAGGLHACRLARSVGIGRVLVPPGASTLSAYGMLAGDVVRSHARTVMLPGDAPREELESRFAPLEERALREVREEGVPPARVELEREMEMRYRGQSHELRVSWGEDPAGRFHRRHRRAYGHAKPGEPVEIVTLRARGVGRVDEPPLPRAEPGAPDPSEALLERREVVLGEGRGAAPREAPFYRAEDLRPGHEVPGPAVVVRRDTTVVLGPGDRGRVDPRFNLVVEVGT